MPPKEIKQYNDAKKASDSDNRSDVGEKYQTHEDRCWNFKRFLTPLALGAMTLTAGMTEARLEPSGSALQRKGYDNITGLTHAFNQTEFNNPSRETALYNSLRDLGMTDEQILKIQQQDQQLKQKHEERQLAKKAIKNSDDHLDGLSKLFEEESSEVKGSAENRQLSEQVSQSTKEVHQGEQNKGKELLKPEEKQIASLRTRKEVVKANRKLLERVWSSVLRRNLAADTTSVVFVHGMNGKTSEPNGGNDGFNCSAWWGDAMTLLASHGYKDFRTIQFYTGDANCTANLLDPQYSKPCADYQANAGPEGTNNESLYHVSCKLAHFLSQEFGKSNSKVALIGHCMGGIIIRETMYQMQIDAGNDGLPATIGHVTDAITLNTPHSGIISLDNAPGISALVCGGCNQAQELERSGTLMSNLINHGQNPQTSGGFTSWTVIGSECDEVLPKADPTLSGGTGVASAIDMHASHAVMYSQDGRTTGSTCYSHAAITYANEATKLDAHMYYCDTTDPGKSPCGIDYATGNEWQYMENGPHGLLAMYDEMTNQL